MEDYPRDVYRIRVGDWDMQVPEAQEQEFRVDTIHFHEQYNVGIPLNNDIAVVRIKVGLTIVESNPESQFLTRMTLPDSNHFCLLSDKGQSADGQGVPVRQQGRTRVPAPRQRRVRAAPQLHGLRVGVDGVAAAGLRQVHASEWRSIAWF